MPIASVVVTASALKRPLVRRSLFLIGMVTALVFITTTAWLATHTKTPLWSCPFRVPSTEGSCLYLDKVSSEQDMRKGLSDRQSIPEDHGLLFDFGSEARRCMWMKAMRFNIDIIWLNSDKTITHIEHNVSPQTYPESFCGNGPARYVIEVNSTVAAQLHSGTKLSI